MPPSLCTPSTEMLTQQFGRPARQAMQVPQEMYGLTTQMSPARKSLSVGASWISTANS
nr:hypothetical protein [uncultured Dongia sp.]